MIPSYLLPLRSSLRTNFWQSSTIQRIFEILLEAARKVSLIPLSAQVFGIVTEGLRYPLCGETLFAGDTRGIGNEFLGSQAKVSVEEGDLLVIVD